jgi:hypothetical protein
MKQALEALETDPCKENAINNAQFFIKQAIAEAEKTIYVDSSRFPKDQLDHKPGMVITEPVHAIDISQERVDETAKGKHEFECPRCGHFCQQRKWVEQPDLAMVGEVGVWGDKPKHEWVEITKGECDELFRASSDHVEYAWAIEAKLKEKNNVLR